MTIKEECYRCLVRLLDLTVTAATSDDNLRKQARKAALAIVEAEFHPHAIPALIANRFHRIIQKISGNPDPFAAHKATETQFLARMFEKVAGHYRDELDSLLKLAVLGNTVDFFRQQAEVTQEILQGVNFSISETTQFQQLIQDHPGLLLYLADNAGEQFFDRPLVTWLRRQNWTVFYVVKGGPIQNDLTRSDLEASGLYQDLGPVVDTGAKTVGLVLDEANQPFRELFQQARIILAKGMGHFETLSHLHDPRIFFLLQAKCPPVAQALSVPNLSFVFARSVSR